MPSPRTASTTASKKAVFSLTEIERERSFEPFTVEIAPGKVITLVDVGELDWQVVAGLSVDRLFQFFKAVVDPDDYDDFLAAKFPKWKMEALLEAYRQHFGIGDQGN